MVQNVTCVMSNAFPLQCGVCTAQSYTKLMFDGWRLFSVKMGIFPVHGCNGFVYVLDSVGLKMQLQYTASTSNSVNSAVSL